jgi:hypothetical protein
MAQTVTLACSIISRHQLAAARVLAESFFAHHPDGSFTLLVVDDERREIAPEREIDRRITWWRLSDLGLDAAETRRLAAIHDVTTLCAAVQPLFLRALVRATGSVVIYLDPDGRVFESLADVSTLAARHGIVLTPYFTEPIPDDGRGIDAQSMLGAGLYNLGFVAAGPSAEPCLEWWRQQSFTDRRVTDYIPSLFDHHLLKDPGCNAAYWNLHERPLSQIDGRVFARNVPLRYFHFSGFDAKAPWLLSRDQGERPRIVPAEHPVLAAICMDYAAALDGAGFVVSGQHRDRAPVTAPPIRWITEKPAGDAAAVAAPATARPATAGWRDVTVALLIALCCLVVYNANGRAIASGDTFAARYQPFALWHDHTLLLDPIEALTSQGRERTTNWEQPSPAAAYWMMPARDGHVASLYPPVVPVLIAPLYLPAVSYVSRHGWTDQRVDVAARIMEKLAASLVAALSASLLYLALRRRTTTRNAILLTAAYAFGTSTWVISSQALWQHGIAQVLVAGAILLLTGPCTAARAATVGLLFGLMTGNRPPDAVLAAALGAYSLFWAGRRVPFVVAGAVVPVALVVLHNVTDIGRVTGAYALAGHAHYFLRHDVRAGLAGLLFSPTRGLFVFSPFLLFLVLAWRHRPRERADRLLTIAMAAGAIVQLALYSLTDWRAGMSWGPRFLTDLLPMLIWMLVPVVEALGRRGRACFTAAVCAGIAIEAVGAFAYTGVTDTAIFATADGRPATLGAAWDWRNAPFIAPLSNGFAPPELLHPMRGSIDIVEVDGHDTDTIGVGQSAIVRGWALAGRSTPLQVAIAVDGVVMEKHAARSFGDRPDVDAVFPGAQPSGWSVPLDTAVLTPGEHHLSLHIWGFDKGDSYFLAKRTLKVQARNGDLGASAMVAAARIRQHQQGPGYWLTAFTNVPRFEKPHEEMNTFLTSLLVDLLDPLPATAGFADSVQHARRHLTAQIEPTGLVRYHGLPDSVTIGILGCAITPDTDDTALVWRIAPAPDPQRQSSAVKTIDEYRTDEGLYRTWLAPRSAYQCLDPGRDPNPADVTIQMHLLQWLLAAKLPEARGLCDALVRHVADDRIWVYYQQTSLVPMLRTQDLERAGCRVTLPAARMQARVPGQEIWISVVQLLMRGSRADGPRPDAAEVARVLETLARNDFALLRTSPPLLYHNDLTATVPRYYWSQDAGYALWLRLAQQR